MKTTDNSILLNRRGFLKSATLLGGAAAAFDIWPLPSAAAATAVGHSITNLSYFSEDGLVDAGTLSADSSLMGSGVHVTIENYVLPDGANPLFRGFVATFMIENDSQSESVPFYAWAPTTPVKRSRFFMPVSPANGILFSVLTNDSHFPVESYYLAVDDARNTAKLRTGMYVISSRSPGTAIAPKNENRTMRLLGTNDQLQYFEHLLIDIARAE
jgi:hypothetical protein